MRSGFVPAGTLQGSPLLDGMSSQGNSGWLRQNWWMCIGLLLVIALVVRAALFMGGIRGSDAYAYAQHAYNIAAGQYDIFGVTQYYGFRYMVLLPTALAYHLLGVGDVSSAVAPLLASLAALVVVVWLGREIFDQRTGLLAGLLYVFFPLDLESASLLGPSSFIPLLSGSAVLAMLYAGKAKAFRPRVLFCLISGLCVGLATEAREIGPLLFMPLGLMVLLWRNHRKIVIGLACLAVGATLPLLAEAFYYWMATGDFFYRAHVIEKLSAAFAGGNDPEGIVSWAFYPKVFFGFDLTGLASYSGFPYLAVGAIALAFYRREGMKIRTLLLWIIPVFGYLEFGSMSLSEYLPILKNHNYLSIVSVPLVLLAAYGLASILWGGADTQNRKSSILVRGFGVFVFIMCLAVTSMYGVYCIRSNIWDDSRPYQVVASLIQNKPAKPVYVLDSRWVLFLNYHLGYQTGSDIHARVRNVEAGRIRFLQGISNQEDLPPSYVVIHQRYLYQDTKGRYVGHVKGLADFVFNPPETWHEVYQEKATPAYNSFALYEIR